MSIIKVGLPFLYSSIQKKSERFGEFLTTFDFENQNCATFDLKN